MANVGTTPLLSFIDSEVRMPRFALSLDGDLVPLEHPGRFTVKIFPVPHAMIIFPRSDSANPLLTASSA